MEGKIRLAVFGQKRLSREGGIEIVVKELCTRMAQNGCEVTCYNRAGHHVSGAEYDKTIEYDGIVEDVSIGDNATIGAGSVVTKDIPSNATAAGNYAKVLNFNNPGRYIQNSYLE